MIETQSFLSPETAADGPAPLPANLPDERSAQRLWALLEQLEAKKGTSAPASLAPVLAAPALDTPRLAALEAENADLKARHAAASQRVAALIQTLAAQGTLETHVVVPDFMKRAAAEIEAEFGEDVTDAPAGPEKAPKEGAPA